MLVPSNATAEAIEKMQQQNFSYQNQLDTLNALMADNERLIEELYPAATWEEVADPDTTDTPDGEGLLPTPFPPPVIPDSDITS